MFISPRKWLHSFLDERVLYAIHEFISLDWRRRDMIFFDSWPSARILRNGLLEGHWRIFCLRVISLILIFAHFLRRYRLHFDVMI